MIAPAQYLLTAADGANLSRFVEGGGTLLVSFFSGIVDENDAVHPGGYGAPLRDALGLTVEEFLPLREGERAAVRWTRDGARALGADAWQEALALEGAEVVGEYADGPGAGMPAITRNAHGDGIGWYVSTRLDADGLATLMRAVYADAGVVPPGHPEGLEVVVRRGAHADYTVAINHGGQMATLPATGVDLLTGATLEHTLELTGGGVAVIRTPRDTEGGDR